MKNPMDNILGKGLQAMLKAIEEELGKLMNQMLQDAVSPEKLAEMLKQMGGAGMDFGQMAGMVGQKPGFDAYKILGLDKSASDEEVKKRYNELLKKLHPDTAGVQGTEFLFQMIMAAMEMIKKERRWQ
jgi:DnaJ-class molecular chaperone